MDDNKALAQENERLRIALQADRQRLERYETLNFLALAIISGVVVSQDEARPILIETRYGDKDIILAVSPHLHFYVKQGERYIFAGEIDGNFDPRCHTHHAILRASHVFPAKMPASGISSRDQLAMFLIAEMVNMFQFDQ